MIEISIKDSWLEQAKKDALDMGRLNKSITNGEGNLAGFLGEIAVANFIQAERKNTFEYDLIKNNLRIDVKTKRCTSEPRPDYACSVAAYNITQDCDIYCFTRILESFRTCWVLGWMEKDEYFKQAAFCKKGEIDSNDSRGWRFKADCYNLEIGKLKDIKNL